jgi:hypothetical protein
MLLTADCETTTDKNDCRVWAWGICEVGNPYYFKYGNTLDTLFDYLMQGDNHTLYFHNLKFDGEFLFVWLFEHGFTHIKDKLEITDKTFTTLISDKGQFYSMEICFKKRGKITHKVTIYDSLKIIPFSVDEVGQTFGLPIKKIKKEKEFYSLFREIGHILTDEETEYLKNDVTVMSLALNTLFSQGLNKMTQGSNALFDYKRTITLNKFKQLFPIPNYDHDVRQSYKGGFTYLNPRFKELDLTEGIVLDVNSLYPSVMRNRPLPYDHGIYFDGRYKKDKLYPLYVQMFTCNFDLKKDYIPTIQIKHNLSFIPTEYLTSSNGEDVTLCLTNIDLELFFTHYDVYNVEYHSGWKFKSTIGLFTEYIDKWTKIKIESKIKGNKGMYTLAKLMLNALYGKFALNPNVRSKFPYYDNGMIRYMLGEKEQRNPIYIPVGTFVTSWARYTTITAAQQVYDRFIYADTDSLHLLGTELPQNLEISDTELGLWKHESTFKRSRFLRQKTYFECNIVSDKEYDTMKLEEQKMCYEYEGTRVIDKITCAGMPSRCYEHVNWDNFQVGESFEGKLKPVHVQGGIVLKEEPYTIKKFVDKKHKK